MDEAVAWFDEEAEAYYKRNHEPSEHLPELLRLLAPASRVLEIGCGPGVDSHQLAQRGHRVVGIDAAPRMIALARREFPGVDFRVGDMRSLDFPPGSFDAIVALYSIIFLPKKEMSSALRQFAALLSPGGMLLLAVQGGGSEEPGTSALFALMTPDEIAARVREAGFTVLKAGERPPRQHEMQFPKLHVFARKA